MRSTTDILHLLPLAISLNYPKSTFSLICHLFRATPSPKTTSRLRATGPNRTASFQVHQNIKCEWNREDKSSSSEVS